MSLADGAFGDLGDPDARALWLSDLLGATAVEAAPLLLGCVLWVRGVGVRLTEVEAYEGADDPASHAWRGQTARNAVMFGPAGHLYVYRIHGHHCVNVVCGPQGHAAAVLLRAGEIVEGLDAACSRRPGVREAWLARGPGNLAKALGLTVADQGAWLGGPDVALRPGGFVCAFVAGPRVNVARAHDRPWRFLVQSPSVSAFRPHPAARRG